MKNTIYFQTLLLISLFITIHKISLSQGKISEVDSFVQMNSKLEIPFMKNQIVLFHGGYSFSYNEKHEQSNWVAYTLNRQKLIKTVGISDVFLVDTMIKTYSANDKDYKGSGYDRGHLAPAGDMSYSEITMKESFYYTNISPQLSGFNRGVWKKMEEQVRSWANEYDTIYIVTGPVLSDSLTSIGINEVSVPNLFYKVILRKSNDDYFGIGFLIKNESTKELIESFAFPIDSIELITNIDFFSILDDSIEIKVEKNICINCWIWDQNKSNSNIDKSNTLRKCKAITREGYQCKRKISDNSEYCDLHHINLRKNERQCHGVTTYGTRCEQFTTNKGGLCFIHEIK